MKALVEVWKDLDPISRAGWVVIVVLIVSIVGMLIGGYSARTQAKIDDDLASQRWVAAGCPVYQSECGSKHKYACERRAPTIGRIIVGDTVVAAYQICLSGAQP